MTLQECPCGSNEFPWIESDARGISIGYVCDKCIAEKKSGYREEIFTNANYAHDEPIDPD
ncbi:MAG: hypothetical protein IIB38_03060 [Candidatus Hydrogenedentes bacterium]|nr:hypothetical protein [Candidatus Hydrogenedentota bacterium]